MAKPPNTNMAKAQVPINTRGIQGFGFAGAATAAGRAGGSDGSCDSVVCGDAREPKSPPSGSGSCLSCAVRA